MTAQIKNERRPSREATTARRRTYAVATFITFVLVVLGQLALLALTGLAFATAGRMTRRSADLRGAERASALLVAGIAMTVIAVTTLAFLHPIGVQLDGPFVLRT